MKVKALLLSCAGLLVLATVITENPPRWMALTMGLISLLSIYFVEKMALAMKLRLAVSALLFALYYIMLSRQISALEPYWIVLTILSMALLIVLKGLKR